MREINKIIIHCTATRPNFMEGRSLKEQVDEVRRWHVVDNNWSDIGYHYLVGRNGEVTEGRPLKRAGAHTKGQNNKSIGIALFGGHGSSQDDAITDHFTAKQIEGLRGLLRLLRKKYPMAAIEGHNKYSNKACPGFQVTEALVKKLLTKAPMIENPKPVKMHWLARFFFAIGTALQKRAA